MLLIAPKQLQMGYKLARWELILLRSPRWARVHEVVVLRVPAVEEEDCVLRAGNCSFAANFLRQYSLDDRTEVMAARQPTL